MASESSPTIKVITKYLPSSDLGLPPLVLQVACLVNSYMLWIGATEVAAEDAVKAPLQGNLAKDWACAMPTLDVRVSMIRNSAL
jgi:proteasome assembly chaperone 4